MAVVSFGWENGGILADGDVIEPGVGVGLVQPVDVEVAAGFVEIVADFAGASAEAAVDPHFAGGDVVDAARNVSHGDIGSGEEVAFSPFFGFANVEDEGWGGAVIETSWKVLTVRDIVVSFLWDGRQPEKWLAPGGPQPRSSSIAITPRGMKGYCIDS